MDLFTYLMAKKGHNTHRDLFSYLLGKNAGGSGTYTTFSGTSLNISNTLKAKIKNFMLNSTELTQDGTPTPDTPQDIHVIKGSNNVKISDGVEEQNYPITLSSDNLINPHTTLEELTNKGITFTPVYDGNSLLYINVNGTASDDVGYYIISPSNRLRLPANSYLISADIDGSNTTYDMRFSAYNLTTYYNYSGNTAITINNSDSFWFQIYIKSGTTMNNVKFKPFVRKSTSTQKYTPYIANPIEYCKIGDYADQFFKNTIDSEFYDSTLLENEWYLKKNIDKVAFNGSENWRERTNSGGVKQFYVSSGSSTLLHYKQFCNYFSNYNQSLFNWGAVGDFAILTNTKVFYGGVSNDITLEDFKSKLAIENLIVYYVLATPQYIHISESDYPILRNQLESLYNNAKSYNGQTNITQTNEDLSFNISVDVKVANL